MKKTADQDDFTRTRDCLDELKDTWEKLKAVALDLDERIHECDQQRIDDANHTLRSVQTRIACTREALANSLMKWRIGCQQFSEQIQSRDPIAVNDALMKSNIHWLIPVITEIVSKAELSLNLKTRSRGRPRKFSEETVEAAVAMKKAGKSNREIARLLHGTPNPSENQTKGVPGILKQRGSSPTSRAKKTLK